MQFITITEYFYKVYSRLLVIVLVPILCFSALYFRTADFYDSEPGYMLALPLSVAVGLLWLAAFIFFNKKIKSIRNSQGLRQKLEKYFELTIVRFTMFLLAAVVLAVGYFIWRDDLFTLLFVFQLVITGFLWPSAAKVCRDLRLRGDEHEMVYYKKDVL